MWGGARERKKRKIKEHRRLDVAYSYTHKHGSGDEQNGRVSGSGMQEKEMRLFDYGDNTSRTRHAIMGHRRQPRTLIVL